jgi:CheY-like chemotaxis protein
VLIVEDDPDLRVLAESNVADFGYSTLSASNGREALVLLDEATSVAVLFTDINMPDAADGIDGIELARRAVQLRPGLRVIYTSGTPPTDGMIALFVEGSTFLRKPYTRGELMQAIRDHCEPPGSTAPAHKG